MISFVMYLENEDQIMTPATDLSSNLVAASNPSDQDRYAKIKEKIQDNYQKHPEDFQKVAGSNELKYSPSGWGATSRSLNWYGFRKGLN